MSGPWLWGGKGSAGWEVLVQGKGGALALPHLPLVSLQQGRAEGQWCQPHLRDAGPGGLGILGR